jgi:hypothetical protein
LYLKSQNVIFQELARLSTSQWRGRNEKQKPSLDTNLYHELEKNLRIRQVQSGKLPDYLLFPAKLFAVI